MSTDATPRSDETAEDADPFRYGWRLVKHVGPDGRETFEEVPLTIDDWVFPQEEDRRVQTFAHNRDCMYLFAALNRHLRGRPGWLAVCDLRVDWQVGDIRPMGPDVLVLSDLREFNENAGTLYVEDSGGRPELLIEVTSPETRHKDIEDKMGLYFQAGVPQYILVDTTRWLPDRVMRLLGYKAGEDGYEPIPLDAGRLWIEPLGLWLALGDQRVALYSPDGKHIGDYNQLAEETEALRAEANAITEQRDDLARQFAEQVDFRQAAQREAGHERLAREAAERQREEAERKSQEAERQREEAERKSQEAERQREEAEHRAEQARLSHEQAAAEKDRQMAELLAKLRELEDKARGA